MFRIATLGLLLFPNLLYAEIIAEYSMNSKHLILGDESGTKFKIFSTSNDELTGVVRLKSKAQCAGFDRAANVFFVVQNNKSKGQVLLSFTRSGKLRFGSRQPYSCKKLHALKNYDAVVVEAPLGNLLLIQSNTGQLIRAEVTKDMRSGAKTRTSFRVTPAGDKFAWIEPSTFQRDRNQWYAEIQFRELSSGKKIQSCRLPSYYSHMYFSDGADYLMAYLHRVSADKEKDRHQLLVFDTLNCKLIASYPLMKIFPNLSNMKLLNNLELKPIALQPTYHLWSGPDFPIFSFLPEDPSVNWLMRDQSLACNEQFLCSLEGSYQNAQVTVSPDGRHYAIYLPGKNYWFRTNPNKFFRLFGGYPELAFSSSKS